MSSSVVSAQGYLDRLIELETKGWGDQSQAVQRIARRASVSPWTFERIRNGRAKSVRVEVMDALRRVYVAACERQIQKLQNELAVERARHGDDHIQDIDRAAAALAAKLEEAKERINS